MAKRSHHQKMVRLLSLLDANKLRDTNCLFAGGTAIALLYGEKRESTDLDFLCEDAPSSLRLRNFLREDFSAIFINAVEIIRTKSNNYATSALVKFEDIVTKIEFVYPNLCFNAQEGRGILDASKVPVLSGTNLLHQKFLANTNRGLSLDVNFRDIIDIATMYPFFNKEINFHKAYKQSVKDFGPSVKNIYNKTLNAILSKNTLEIAMKNMAVSLSANWLIFTTDTVSKKIELSQPGIEQIQRIKALSLSKTPYGAFARNKKEFSDLLFIFLSKRLNLSLDAALNLVLEESPASLNKERIFLIENYVRKMEELEDFQGMMFER